MSVEPAVVVSAKPAARSAPKWETDTRERLKAALRKYSKPLADLLSRDANEGDTRLLVTDFLCDALGYDKYEDLTTEFLVRGEFADYGIRVDKQLAAFIEVKRVATKLGEKHLRQVEMYAVNEGVEWLILTNGAHWQVYHLTVRTGLPAQIDLALDMDILSDATPAKKVNEFFFLTKEAMKRDLIDDVWKAKRATSPKSLAQVLLSESVVASVQREIRRRTGHNAPSTEIAGFLRAVIRPDALEK